MKQDDQPAREGIPAFRSREEANNYSDDEGYAILPGTDPEAAPSRARQLREAAFGQ